MSIGGCFEEDWRMLWGKIGGYFGEDGKMTKMIKEVHPYALPLCLHFLVATSFNIFCYKRGNLRKAFISGRFCLGWEDVFIVDGGMMFR